MLADYEIKTLALEGMIEPYYDHLISERDGYRIPSYGQSSAGYDVTLSYDFIAFNSQPNKYLVMDVLNPKTCEGESIVTDCFILPPNHMVLARTVETFKMPTNVCAVCVGKSTWARVGIVCNVTPLEPAWYGTLTLELSNTSALPVALHAGVGIAQIQFFSINEPRTNYQTRNGKYNGQVGVTTARL